MKCGAFFVFKFNNFHYGEEGNRNEEARNIKSEKLRNWTFFRSSCDKIKERGDGRKKTGRIGGFRGWFWFIKIK